MEDRIGAALLALLLTGLGVLVCFAVAFVVTTVPLGWLVVAGLVLVWIAWYVTLS
jgi:hypothetical protein